MKNVFDRLISRLNTKRGKNLSELENMTIETLKTKKQRKSD